MSDDLVLVIGDNAITGWTNTRITRGIERLPSDFDIGFTERYPGQIEEITARPGDPCTVMIGGDVMITGYVDRYMPMIQGRTHSIRVTGRSKCQDLVDCAAEWPGGQIVGSSALEVSQKLSQPYGIQVTGIADGGRIPQYNLCLGSTAFENIELICRYIGLLAFDQTDGNLLLARVGTDKAAGGFQEGTNVEAASLMYSMDQRFSEYLCFLQSVDVFQDLGDGGNLIATAKDQAVPRHRRRVIIAESGSGVAGINVSQQRALWECARRFGRSAALRITTDGWRDAAGSLWQINTLVDIDLPSLHAPKKTWLISEVTFRRDMSGTHADLIIMPPDAFLPEPITLNPAQADIPNFSVPQP